MNKFAKSMCMMAVVALAFTSCKKNEQATFACATEPLQSVDDEFEKAYIDDAGKMCFEVGDNVAVFRLGVGDNYAASEMFMGTATTSGPNAAFVGNVSDLPAMGGFYSYYPYEGVKRNRLTSGNRVVFRLEPTQVYRAENGNPLIPRGALYMAAKDENATKLSECKFDYKNICGVLSLKLYDPQGRKVEYIQVTDKKMNLSGNVQFRIDRVDPTEMTSVLNGFISNNGSQEYLNSLQQYMSWIAYEHSNNTNTITLDCTQNGGPVALGTTKANATRFLIVLRPGALLHGCKVKVKVEGLDKPMTVIDSDKNNVIRPNYIRNMVACSL